MAMTPVTIPYTGIDPAVVLNEDLVRHGDRIVFGSDFPNLPYPYEEERRAVGPRPAARRLPADLPRQRVPLLRGQTLTSGQLLARRVEKCPEVGV